MRLSQSSVTATVGRKYIKSGEIIYLSREIEMPDGDSKEDCNGDSKEDNLEQAMEQVIEQLWSKHEASNRASNS